MTNILISLSEFSNATDNEPKPQEIGWPHLVQRLIQHESRPGKSGAAWSPVRYLPGQKRGKSGIETVSCLVLDIDDGVPTAALWNDWKTPGGQPLAYCIHSTFSSTQASPKWRVVFPLALPVPAAAWPAVHQKLALALAAGHADPACKDASRLYYWPSCPPELVSAAFADIGEGVFLSPDDFPDPAPEETAEAKMRFAFRSGSPQAQGNDRSDADGDRPGDDFNARGDCLNILERHGWQVVRGKGSMALLRRPGKSADYSGTFGYGGTRMFFCFTSSAPPFEANTGYSPMGVYALLEHGGDYAEAARQLRQEGYGKAPESKTRATETAKAVETQAVPEVAAPPETEWELPLPFTAYALPAFPLEALPEALSGFVSEVAASVQVSLDMPALLGIGVVGAAASRSCRVQIGQTHAEPLNLYVAVTAEPGERKSQTMKDMTDVLRDAERELAQGASSQIAAAREARALEEKRIGHLRDMAAKYKTGDMNQEREELMALAGSLTEVPPLPRLLADDVTPEKLAELMAEQGGTLTIASAEGGIFGILAGRYSDGKTNLDLFLKAHAGEEVRIDRKNGTSVHIPSACLSLLLAVQPDVLSSLAETPSFRGRGLIGRFLYALPQTLVGTRLYQNRPASAADRGRYTRAIRSILDLPSASTPNQPAARYDLCLAGGALGMWKEYADDIERRQAAGGNLSDLSDWASKLAGAVARIAGGFHLVENAAQGSPWATPISAANVERAWAIGEYLTEHAQAAYGQMQTSPSASLARRLLRWVDRTAPIKFTLREAHRAHQNVAGIVSVQDLVPALTLLCERGYLREQPVKNTGGRPPSPTYEVNPALRHNLK